MNILFLGGFFEEDMEQKILDNSKGPVQHAANKFQWNLIEGFLNDNKINMTLISAPFIEAFPKGYKDFYFRGKNSMFKNSVKTDYVNFTNIWGYRNVSRKKNLINKVKDFLLHDSSDKIIIVYSAHTPLLQAAIYAKKIDPTIHICIILPDLPQYMNLSTKRSYMYDFFKKIDILNFNKNIKCVDSLVLLTSQMRDLVKVKDIPYIVIEGMVNSSIALKNISPEELQNNQKNNFSVVYSGTLNEKFGVVNLIKAFNKVKNKDVFLYICGSGDSEKIIKQYSTKDSRIKFLGQLSNEKVLQIQRNATVLINPRQNNEEFTKYSFPSKNMEYLLSGVPLIAYKLDGIPNEYDSYIQYVDDDTIESLTEKIEQVLNLSQEVRKIIGNKAQSYVLKEKNNIQAANKIISMIKNRKIK